ncbi:MAG: phosphoribosylglycinamide formyltransferase [Flavobacteriales bacterium]|nr:phosphoribosylglycinamide formyltransferase [Flavobacteriales bacterium]
MIELAVFASGNGSNAEVLYRYFESHPRIRISLICTNNAHAGVIGRGQRLNVPVVVFSSAMLNGGALSPLLSKFNISGIVLAGFLKLIPFDLIDAYPDAILNIHPSLLPAYGGKGMYGSRVHEAVLAAGEKNSGITIHLVNREYDKGRVLFQEGLEIHPSETPESLAGRIHQLEHTYFPKVVERYFDEVWHG